MISQKKKLTGSREKVSKFKKIIHFFKKKILFKNFISVDGAVKARVEILDEGQEKYD